MRPRPRGRAPHRSMLAGIAYVVNAPHETGHLRLRGLSAAQVRAQELRLRHGRPGRTETQGPCIVPVLTDTNLTPTRANNGEHPRQPPTENMHICRYLWTLTTSCDIMSLPSHGKGRPYTPNTPLVHQPTRTTANGSNDPVETIRLFAGKSEQLRTSTNLLVLPYKEGVAGSTLASPT